MASKEPEQVHCPDCGTPIVLLPLGLYARADLRSEDLPDVVPHTWGGAVFAIVDDEGCYTCPECGRAQCLEP